MHKIRIFCRGVVPDTPLNEVALYYMNKIYSIYDSDNLIKMRIFVQFESKSALPKILSLSFGTADKIVGNVPFVRRFTIS